jgi:predicted small secreted protein
MIILFVSVFLSACGTLGGAVSGAGEDLQRAGEWIKQDKKGQ